MGTRKRIVGGGVAAIAVLAASTVGVGRLAYERRASREVEELFAASEGAEPAVVTEADLAGLPAPVQRWLRYSQVVGKVRPVAVRLKQEGQLRLKDRGWLPFTAEEYYTIDPPGFIWAATVEMAPLVSVVGRDRYAGGKGQLEFRLLSLIPVAKDSGPDMDRADLLRYLNEIMWFPAGALSPYITWAGIDATSARATMSFGEATATATFVFDEQGRLTNMVAERFDRDAGAVEPWSTPIRAHGEFNGVRIPVEGEAVYARSSGEFPYIRVRVTEIDYNRLSRF
jgi:hypothetical protein